VLVNAYSVTFRRQPAYAAVLCRAEAIPLADGAPLALGARLTGQGDMVRCPDRTSWRLRRNAQQ